MNNRGNVLRHGGHFEEALEAYKTALSIKPDYAEALSNCGTVLHDLGRSEEAVLWHDKALAVSPRSARALTNRGNTLRSLLRIEEALHMYAKALAIDPDCANAHANEAMCRLLLGDLARGWPKFEWRWQSEQLNSAKRNFVEPLWLGKEDLAGKSILLHAEQGLGDTIQFCRYAPMLARRGARVILEVAPSLTSLLQSLGGIESMVGQGEPVPRFDLHCPLMSLPLAFGTTLAAIPSEVPYLSADAERIVTWRERLARLPGPKVGIVWANNPRRQDAQAHLLDQRRSIRLSQAAPLARAGGVTFVSLQKGEPAAEAASPPAGMRLVDWTPELVDFAETAALLVNLQLVISIDTSVAHLAGALAKPIWLLCRHDSEWRWLLNRQDSPWYPTMRIFRQPRPGDWQTVMEQVATELEKPGAFLQGSRADNRDETRQTTDR